MNKNEIFSYLKQHANGTVLSFPERGPWGSSSYRGNFSGWIPAAIIYRYGAGSVSEIFAGGGTTSDLCRDLEIPYCGIDLNPAPVRNNILTMDIMDEESELPDAFYEADLQMIHPPYPCINHLHVSNETLYNALKNHSKCKNNKNYEAKIRQTLQKLAASGVLFHTGRGTWKIAA